MRAVWVLSKCSSTRCGPSGPRPPRTQSSSSLSALPPVKRLKSFHLQVAQLALLPWIGECFGGCPLTQADNKKCFMLYVLRVRDGSLWEKDLALRDGQVADLKSGWSSKGDGS